MAGANSNIQITDLDFNNIKTNLKKFLQSQTVLQDYNYEGSALSTLLDVLAYNTHYNAFYLNMVANEMFLDSALLRSSVVSQAKVLNYVPKSSIAPAATINLTMPGITSSSLTLPQFTRFMSEAIDGINYTFVTDDSFTVNTVSNVASFKNVVLKQGIPTTISFTVDSIANPTNTFEIPESNVDTTTLLVTVQKSSSDNSTQVYNLASNYLTLNGDSQVYFLQESLTGTYQIYFGDGVLGTLLSDGNIVNVSYVVTQGTAAAGANNFVLMDTISGYSISTVTPITPASQGGNKESIDSIKFQAPKAYAAQGRAVTKNDYITAIQQNNLGYSFDAVNVWGGEDNVPPIYGQVFVSIKPTGSYTLTNTQKQQIISQVINPISVLTVTPTLIDPDYTYVVFDIDVYYDPTKTTSTSSLLQTAIVSTVQNWATKNLNTFNSTLNYYSLATAIQSIDNSIINFNCDDIMLQKKFFPDLSLAKSYILPFNTTLARGSLLSGVTSYPGMTFNDPTNLTNTISEVYIEEVPTALFGVESLSIVNPGYNYQYTPTVTIIGDGTGATAHAIITNGSIQSIVVDDAGDGYTAAIATITPAAGDTGQNGAVTVNLLGQFGTLRTYYNNSNNVKTILNANAGTIDYVNGIIALNNFNPVSINNILGQLTVSVNPTGEIISSTFNNILTLDQYDPMAVAVNITAKTS